VGQKKSCIKLHGSGLDAFLSTSIMYRHIFSSSDLRGLPQIKSSSRDYFT